MFGAQSSSMPVTSFHQFWILLATAQLKRIQCFDKDCLQLLRLYTFTLPRHPVLLHHGVPRCWVPWYWLDCAHLGFVGHYVAW